jgi:hypothetical protein
VFGELSYQGSEFPLSKSLFNNTRAKGGSISGDWRIFTLSTFLDTGTAKQAAAMRIKENNDLKVLLLILFALL